jgi:hypothetical protein
MLEKDIYRANYLQAYTLLPHLNPSRKDTPRDEPASFHPPIPVSLRPEGHPTAGRPILLLCSSVYLTAALLPCPPAAKSQNLIRPSQRLSGTVFATRHVCHARKISMPAGMMTSRATMLTAIPILALAAAVGSFCNDGSEVVTACWLVR